jgi:2-phospho-L-lactate/phosphoenolpyruvate guanylyltransferase
MVGPREDVGVLVVPIRSFAHGKARLASVLGDAARHDLVREMARRVVAAAGRLQTVVVTSDDEVTRLASAWGADVVDDPGTLDGAADAGRAWARARGAVRIVVAHADIPGAHDLDALAASGAAPIAVLVPDHHGDGTPVLSVPSDAAFAFSYGPGSYARHCAAADRAGLRVRVVDDAALRFDVDDAADLAALSALRPS